MVELPAMLQLPKGRQLIMLASSLKAGHLRVESPAAIIQRAKVKQPTARCSKSVLSISYLTSIILGEIQKRSSVPVA